MLELVIGALKALMLVPFQALLRSLTVRQCQSGLVVDCSAFWVLAKSLLHCQDRKRWLVGVFYKDDKA